MIDLVIKDEKPKLQAQPVRRLLLSFKEANVRKKLCLSGRGQKTDETIFSSQIAVRRVITTSHRMGITEPLKRKKIIFSR